MYFCSSGVFQSTLPHGERRRFHGSSRTRELFQSTLPHGERRSFPLHQKQYDIFQSTLPAWGATLIALFITSRFLISIHAPRMGSDGRIDIVTMLQIPFQSTLPAWGATTAPDQIRLCRLHFNPRSPHGERHGEPTVPSG